jgi:hypothetical protein
MRAREAAMKRMVMMIEKDELEGGYPHDSESLYLDVLG